jgi:hypothetical protein
MLEGENILDIKSHEETSLLRQKQLDKLRKAVDSPQCEQVEQLGDTVKMVMYDCLRRQGSNPEIIELFNDLLNHMHNSLLAESPQDTSGEQVITQSRNDDVKAALLGASMVLDPTTERLSMPRQQPVGNMRYLHRFLEMVQRRVGKLDEASGASEIRIRISPQAAAPTVKYTPKPK